LYVARTQKITKSIDSKREVVKLHIKNLESQEIEIGNNPSKDSRSERNEAKRIKRSLSESQKWKQLPL
jgi:hypothetical protein